MFINGTEELLRLVFADYDGLLYTTRLSDAGETGQTNLRQYAPL